MEGVSSVQNRFFNELKTKLPPNLSMAVVVAEELNISIDSAYRRIRGESELSLREFDVLSSKYSVDHEAILSNTSENVLFKYRSIVPERFGFNSYFQSLIDEMKSLEKFGLKEIIYAALDLPMFYYFMFPKLAAFKLYFWRRNVFVHTATEEKPYVFEDISAEDIAHSHQMLRTYLTIPTTEIWSEETINTTLRQIFFFYDMGLFLKKQDVIDVLNDLKSVIDHVQKQAELGNKFYPGHISPLNGEKNNFKIYHNEVTLSENVILLRLENFNVVHLGHNVLNILTTTNEVFFQDSMQFIDQVMRNSTLISISAERERKRFFNVLFRKIDALLANI